jgi:sugar phosphate permease
VTGPLKALEDRTAYDFLARQAFSSAEGIKRLFKCLVGANGKRHPYMVSEWYQFWTVLASCALFQR